MIYNTRLFSRSQWGRTGEGQRVETCSVCLELLSFRGAHVNMARLEFWNRGVSETSKV